MALSKDFLAKLEALTPVQRENLARLAKARQDGGKEALGAVLREIKAEKKEGEEEGR